MSLPPPVPPPITAVDRRSLFKLGALGLGALAVPVLGHGAGGFTHGVASGEPGPRQVLLWARYVGGGDTKLTWEISDSQDFAKLAASGEAIASPERDWCAKATAAGLAPNRWYYYRFVAPSGATSAIGRTRTLPLGKTPKFRIAVFSCSNFGFGWFNAYAHAAEAGDFDLALHLGDYLYEYKRGTYPSAKQTLAGRVLPLDEMVTLAGYRERYATYRADPDLQRLHQLYPMIAVPDDHESANDSWKDGAENHQPDEGDWGLRKAAAQRAYREWLPVSDDDFAAYEIGDLATLFRLETRLSARTRPVDLVGAWKSAAPGQAEAALAAFRDGAWRDPAHTLLGGEQEAWLAAMLSASKRTRKTWQVLAQQVIMGRLAMNERVLDVLKPDAPGWLRERLSASVSGARLGLPFNMDAWDGYPAARARLLKASLEANADLLVLAGDSHNAWAFDLDHEGARGGVEFAGQSVTSPGAESSLPWIKPDVLARDSVAANPQLKWCDTSRRGYLALELTPKSATGEFRFLATVREKGTTLAGTQRLTVLAGQRRFAAV